MKRELLDILSSFELLLFLLNRTYKPTMYFCVCLTSQLLLVCKNMANDIWDFITICIYRIPFFLKKKFCTSSLLIFGAESAVSNIRTETGRLVSAQPHYYRHPGTTINRPCNISISNHLQHLATNWHLFVYYQRHTEVYVHKLTTWFSNDIPAPVPKY